MRYRCNEFFCEWTNERMNELMNDNECYVDVVILCVTDRQVYYAVKC